jgi:histidine triad (HIT) family protein
MTDATATDSCIFCRIVRGDFGTEFITQNEVAVAFRDLHPQAPSHILIVPRRHLSALRELTPADAPIAAALLAMAVEVAEREGLLAGGYRVTTNDGTDAGQTVHHLHFHVLGGRRLHEPLG